MAEKILKSINFPGLEDTYIIPEVDNTLKKSGSPADAKAVGDALTTKQPIGNYVKSINGNTPDEDGNVTIEVGSGGSGGSSGSSTTRETILAEQVLVFSEISNGNGLGQWYGVESPFALVDGAEYIVDWNGTEYDVVAVAAESLGEGAIAIGNLSLVLGDSSTDEPFIFVYGSGSVFGYATNGTYRVAIYKINTAPSSIQSDWNVIDETSPAYIKNKPLVEAVSLVDIQPFIQSDKFVLDPTYNLYCISDWVDYSLTIGKSYIVYWDGVEYECIGQNGDSLVSGSVLLGNLTEFGLSGNNEPFIIANIPNYGSQFFSLTDTEEGCSHTIRIAEGETVQKIDPKYLYAPDWTVTDETDPAYIKNRPFGETRTQATLIDGSYNYVYDESNAEWDAESIIPVTSDTHLIVGNTYTVTWNGVDYICEAFEAEGLVAVGNTMVAGGADNGIPFAIGEDPDGAMFGSPCFIFVVGENPDPAVSTVVTYTIKLAFDDLVVQKIDPKYLPDDIGNESTESVQSDWNVTDETNPAYIKNKPFGEIPNTWVPLLASREFGPFYTNASYGVQMYTRIATFRLVIGETYRITWDGEVYECAAQDVNAILPGGIALGNGAAFGLAGNNEPFIIYIANGYEGYMSLTDTAAGATHTVGIEEIGTVIHKIEPKYLHNADWNIVDKNEAGYIANRPFGVVPSGTAIVEETTFNFAANTLHHFPLPNIGPFDYKVEFDGIEYFATGEVYETDSIPQYGFTISTPEDGELFLLVKNFEGREGVDIIAANEGEHTFKITAAEDIIEKIDSKYLPDDIGGSSGPSLPTVTAADAGKFLRVTDEGIWAAVSIPNAEGVGF